MMDAERRTAVREAIVLAVALSVAIAVGFAISVAVAMAGGLLRSDRFGSERGEAAAVAVALR
jgi:ABC-type uncharacterized transport system YnjBCD permease subunit